MNSKLPQGKHIEDARVFMPHEQKHETQELSLEEYMMQKFGDGNND